MKRRHFLQFTGGFLGALGLSQLELRNKSLQYGKVLAQNTSRKLALLVGINGYSGGAALDGCVNDVYLQRELLIHRFGFNPNDILLVTDEDGERPTRNNILTAFDEHLIKQAKADDVVVFHYSGHGYQVIDETQSDQRNSTFVPIDHQFKRRNNRQDELEVNHIMGHTLYLLMSAIKTENFTAVLDCCHSGGGTRGSTKIRAFQIPKELTRNLNTEPKIYPNQEELNYQENLLSQLGLNREDATNLWNQKIAKGMVLAAAQEVELAADGTSVGYDAGAFTYALTQYLWQFSGDNPVKEVMRGVSLGTTRLSPNGQHPLYEVHPEDNNQQPIYFLNPTTPNGEGVIKKVNNNEVELWLGGFNPQILTGASKYSVFRVVDQNGEDKGDIIVQDRIGLKATAIPYSDPNSEVPKPLENPAEGDFIREKAIAIPEDFALLIALDQSLQQYQQELVNDDGFIDDKIKIVPLNSEQNSTEKPDYILGEMTKEARQLQIEQEVLANLPEIGSRGIFDSALNVIPESFAVGEDIKAFKDRLIPKLRSFLGLKLIRTLFGGQGASTNSNRLQVSAELKIMTPDNQEFTLSSERGISPNFDPQQMEGAIPLLTVGTQTQLKITNNTHQSLYIAVLVFDQIGNLRTVFPDYIYGARDEALFGAGETFVINDQSQKVSQSSNYIPVTDDPLGTTELLILASLEPIQKPLKTLAELMNKTRSRGALDVMGDILVDTRGWGTSRDLSLPVNVVGSTSLTFKAIAQ